MTKIERALKFAVKYGGIDGDHHKAWVIDQMVRALSGCRMVTASGIDYKGDHYTCKIQGESRAYKALVAAACDGEDGPATWEWNVGIAP